MIGIDIEILTASDIIIFGVCKWENISLLPVLKLEPVRNKYFKSSEFFNSFFWILKFILYFSSIFLIIKSFLLSFFKMKFFTIFFLFSSNIDSSFLILIFVFFYWLLYFVKIYIDWKFSSFEIFWVWLTLISVNGEWFYYESSLYWFRSIFLREERVNFSI